MSNFLLTVKVISVHTASSRYTWCLVWPGGAAVHAEERFLFQFQQTGVFWRLIACVTLVKLHSKPMLATGLLEDKVQIVQKIEDLNGNDNKQPLNSAHQLSSVIS